MLCKEFDTTYLTSQGTATFFLIIII